MITVTKISDNGFVIVVEGVVSNNAFKELVQRATNLWPDASPEIKHFADEITNRDLLATHGKLQNYESQNTSPPSKRINVICEVCRSDNLIDVHNKSPRVIWKCTHCMASNQTAVNHERTRIQNYSSQL